MQKHTPKHVVAVVNDLFFIAKIMESAKRAGMGVTFVKESKEALAHAKTLPTLMIFDLNFDAVEPLKLIEELKADSETKRIPLIAYLSHVQGELKQKAHETGCDMVLAKSAFSQNLPQILKRHAGVVV